MKKLGVVPQKAEHDARRARLEQCGTEGLQLAGA